ncbi:MAG: diaminopimelate epimerase [Flavobacteriales bacterium]|nr:MAG: diaminopimelate epimerase [Flavobacteriales bacterium]
MEGRASKGFNAIFAAMDKQPQAFSKWEGTGNDFILVDDHKGLFPAHDIPYVRQLCDRHYGIGSDGLILLQKAKSDRLDFHMEFFNPDGSRSFCGNGSRCTFAFWSKLTGGSSARFTAVDGEHSAEWHEGEVAVSLAYVPYVGHDPAEPMVDFIHNGSPHELVWVEDPATVDVRTEGAKRRWAPRRGEGGTNVNFVRWRDGRMEIRTFERGVEDETMSCGTGVVAAAISGLHRIHMPSPVHVRARGGDLRVEAELVDREGYGNIKLIGPAREVFGGQLPPRR